MEGKFYLSDAGAIMWVPDDPTNYEYKLAQTGWYAEVDPETGAPLEGEMERAEGVRQAAIEAEQAVPEQAARVAEPEDDPEARERLAAQMAGRLLP